MVSGQRAVGSVGARSRRPAPTANSPAADASGPVLALCTGHRCTALRQLAGSEGAVDDLRAAVRDSRGGVLVVVDCLGVCAVAAVAAVARRDGATGRTGRAVWLGGLEQPARADGLQRWMRAGGPAHMDHPSTDLPSPLEAAVIGHGPPGSVSW